MAFGGATEGRGWLRGLRISMKEGRKEFGEAWFQSPLEEKVFSGEGSRQVGRRPNLQGIRPLRAHWCVYSQPLTASSPCPPALHRRRRILPKE